MMSSYLQSTLLHISTQQTARKVNQKLNTTENRLKSEMRPVQIGIITGSAAVGGG